MCDINTSSSGLKVIAKVKVIQKYDRSNLKVKVTNHGIMYYHKEYIYAI